MNKLDSFHGKKPTDTTREWNSQPQKDHFKFRSSPPKTSPVVSDITGKFNHHAIDNCDVEVQYSEFPFEFNFE